MDDTDPLDRAVEECEAARVSKAEIWQRTGGDYYGAEYQAAQARYDAALAKYNRLARGESQ